MPYITSVERIGMRRGLAQGLAEGLQQGRREGLLDGIALGLELKFGDDGQPMIAELRQIADLNIIQAVYDAIKAANTLAELRRIYDTAITQEE